MSRSLYHNVVTAKEYATLHGISERTARRRLADNPDAIKTGRGYKVSIPSTTYAKLKGISPKVARKTAIKSDNPLKVIADTIPGTSPVKLLGHLIGLLGPAIEPIDYGRVKQGITKMTARQRALAAQLRTYDDYIDALHGDDFYDDEGDSLLWYH